MVKYLIAVRVYGDVKIFEFDTLAERSAYIDELKRMNLAGVDWATSEVHDDE